MTFATSDKTGKLDAALSQIQGKLKGAAKDSTNPHLKSKYADLGSIWAACRAELAEAGVSVTQWPVHSDDGRLHLLTRLALGEEWMRAEMSLPVQKADPQGYGSAITYAKRYALGAAVGVVAADEDDDGHDASQKPALPPSPPLVPPSQNAAATQPAPPKGEAAAMQWVQQQKPVIEALADQLDIRLWKDANDAKITALEKYPRIHEYLNALLSERGGKLEATRF